VANPNGLQYPSFCMKCVYRNSGICSRICMICVQKKQTDVPSKFERRTGKAKVADGSEQDLFGGR
jgi:hypothetical protein